MEYSTDGGRIWNADPCAVGHSRCGQVTTAQSRPSFDPNLFGMGAQMMQPIPAAPMLYAPAVAPTPPPQITFPAITMPQSQPVPSLQQLMPQPSPSVTCVHNGFITTCR